MELRDTNRDAAYFERRVGRGKDGIARRERELEGRPSNSSSLEGSLALDYKELLWAMYSAGCPVADLKPVFSKWLEYESLTLPGYVNPYFLEPLYSVAALLGTSERDRRILQSMFDAVRGADAHASFMAAYLGLDYDRKAEKSDWKFFVRASAIEDKAERTEYTGWYLRRYWYVSNQWQAWWGTHKRDTGAYYGYWAFDVAAVVRAWGLDDSSFAGFKYYPADMARFLDG